MRTYIERVEWRWCCVQPYHTTIELTSLDEKAMRAPSALIATLVYLYARRVTVVTVSLCTEGDQTHALHSPSTLPCREGVRSGPAEQNTTRMASLFTATSRIDSLSIAHVAWQPRDGCSRLTIGRYGFPMRTQCDYRLR